METVDTDVFWSRVVDAPDCFGELQVTDAAWHERAVVVWRVVGETLVQREGNDMLVAAWENNLGLAAADGAEPGARKVALLNHMCSEGLPVPAGLLESVLTRMLGEGRARVKHSGDTLTVSVALDTTEEQIAEVQKMLDRVLPRNLVTELDPFPCDFEKVEYLESNTRTYIKTDINSDTNIGLQVRCSFSNNNNNNFIFVDSTPYKSYIGITDNAIRVRRYGIFNLNIPYTPDILTTQYNYKNSRIAKIDGNVFGPTDYVILNANGDLVTFFYSENITQACLYAAEITKGTDVVRNLIPALDSTGAPCLFDLVTKTPFYNSGTGDFLYPGKETEATTYSLRNRMYAQLTEHGVRRLYRVPAGYNGGKEEYAADHGFKLLVETPMPEDGYWEPVWHEREDCIELEWVETEAPEEGLEP